MKVIFILISRKELRIRNNFSFLFPYSRSAQVEVRLVTFGKICDGRVIIDMFFEKTNLKINISCINWTVLMENKLIRNFFKKPEIVFISPLLTTGWSSSLTQVISILSSYMFRRGLLTLNNVNKAVVKLLFASYLFLMFRFFHQSNFVQ